MFDAATKADFAMSVMCGPALESAVEWIKYNLAPEDVFSTGALERWAEERGWVEGDYGSRQPRSAE